VAARVSLRHQAILPAADQHLLHSRPELVGNDGFDLAGHDVLGRVPPPLAGVLALNSCLTIEDANAAIDRVGEDRGQAGLVSQIRDATTISS
jgi:hypothetical protein